MWPIVSSVLTVFLIILIGALGRRVGWLQSSADQSLARLTTFILVPAFFVDRILAGELADLSQTWQAPLTGFVTTASGLLLGLLFAKTIGRKWIGLDTDAKQRSFALAVGICNYGYIPLPLADKLYPDAMVTLILHNVGVDLALWSVGVMVLCGLKAGGWKRVLVNPPLIAAVFALFIKQFLPENSLPPVIMEVAKWLADCAIPMGLILSGALMCDYFRSFVQDQQWRGNGRVFLAAVAMRQFAFPVLMLLIAGGLISSTQLLEVVSLQAAMPAAIFPIVLARLYDKDSTIALQAVLATATAAVVLIPAWLSIGRWWFGI